jgi:outer membrane protein assembly factor BamB
MEKAIGILVCMLLITVAVIPAAGFSNKNTDVLEDQQNFVKTNEIGQIGKETDWWPMFRHDSGNTGSSLSLAPNTGRLDWQTNIGEEIMSGAPVVSDSKVYVSTNWYYDIIEPPAIGDITEQIKSERPSAIDIINEMTTYNETYLGGIYCLDGDDGTILWNKVLYAPNDAAVIDDKVYVTDFNLYSYGSNLYCLDPATGAVLWQKPIPNGLVTSSTIIVDDKIYLCSLDLYGYSGDMLCLDLNGNIEWAYNLPYGELLLGSTPAVCDGRVFFKSVDLYGYTGGNLYCLNAETGQYLWSRPVSGSFYSFYGGSVPVCSGDYVYLADMDIYSYDTDLICYEAATGATVWTYTTGISFSSPSICDGSIYFSAIDIDSYETKVYRLNAESGSLIWQKGLPGLAYFGYAGSPVVADSKVYLSLVDWSGYTQNIYCLSIEDGSIVWNNNFGNFLSLSGISIADGRLYTADFYGFVYAFEDLIQATISGGLGVKLLLVNTDDTEIATVNWSIKITGGLFGMINRDKGDECTIEPGNQRTERVIPFGLGDITIIVKVSLSGYTFTKWLKGIAIGPIVILS